MRKSKVVHQKSCRSLFLEIPKHTLRQPADSRIGNTAQFHGNVIAWKQYLVDFFKKFRLVFFHPFQFGCRKIARRVQEMGKAFLSPNVMKSLVAVWHGPRVTPDNGRAQNILLPVNAYETVHLIRNSNSQNVISLHSRVVHDLSQPLF